MNERLEAREALEGYAKRHLNHVLKKPHGWIRYPFIDPGSIYDGNVWDWDTYWASYALLGMKDSLSPEDWQRVLAHAKGNVQNFLDHQLEDGYIPMMIEVGKLPEPYLNMMHKKGVRMNMHKPFLCQQIALISRSGGSWDWAAPFVDGLERYFACYDTYFHPRSGLYVWADDIMIGMDNDPATFGRPKDATANIFLNAFMVRELQCMADILAMTGHLNRVDAYARKRAALIESIQRECWDPRDRFFYSVDVDIKTRAFDWFHKGLGVFWNTLPIKIRAWSGFLPLLCGFATREQAEALARHSMDEATFASPFGVTTLAKDEKMFNLSATNNPSNWLGPIWVVASYAVFRGLMDYDQLEAAERVLNGTVRLLLKDLRKTGTLHEYYNPFTGEPVMNGDFVNWNLLALSMLREWEERG